MLRKSHILFFLCVFSFAFCLTNGFADNDSSVPNANDWLVEDIFIEDFDFPTAEGAAYIKATLNIKGAPIELLVIQTLKKCGTSPQIVRITSLAPKSACFVYRSGTIQTAAGYVQAFW